MVDFNRLLRIQRLAAQMYHDATRERGPKWEQLGPDTRNLWFEDAKKLIDDPAYHVIQPDSRTPQNTPPTGEHPVSVQVTLSFETLASAAAALAKLDGAATVTAATSVEKTEAAVKPAGKPKPSAVTAAGPSPAPTPPAASSGPTRKDVANAVSAVVTTEAGKATALKVLSSFKQALRIEGVEGDNPKAGEPCRAGKQLRDEDLGPFLKALEIALAAPAEEDMS